MKEYYLGSESWQGFEICMIEDGRKFYLYKLGKDIKNSSWGSDHSYAKHIKNKKRAQEIVDMFNSINESINESRIKFVEPKYNTSWTKYENALFKMQLNIEDMADACNNAKTVKRICHCNGVVGDDDCVLIAQHNELPITLFFFFDSVGGVTVYKIMEHNEKFTKTSDYKEITRWHYDDSTVQSNFETILMYLKDDFNDVWTSD